LVVNRWLKVKEKSPRGPFGVSVIFIDCKTAKGCYAQGLIKRSAESAPEASLARLGFGAKPHVYGLDNILNYDG
jgi:hypothetical protein